jgi:hypothetical protein
MQSCDLLGVKTISAGLPAAILTHFTYPKLSATDWLPSPFASSSFAPLCWRAEHQCHLPRCLLCGDDDTHLCRPEGLFSRSLVSILFYFSFVVSESRVRSFMSLFSHLHHLPRLCFDDPIVLSSAPNPCLLQTALLKIIFCKPSCPFYSANVLRRMRQKLLPDSTLFPLSSLYAYHAGLLPLVFVCLFLCLFLNLFVFACYSVFVSIYQFLFAL